MPLSVSAQLAFDFGPFWTASERDKYIRLTVFARYRHRVLVQLVMIAWPIDECRWKYDARADLSSIGVASIDSVDNACGAKR